MMINITVLMCTVSLDLQLPACVIIHNQCLNTKLVSPVYFGNGAVCPKLSDQQIDIDAKMNASFEIYATQDDFEGALIYKLQRYIEPDVRCDTDILTTEANKNETKCVHMLVAWKVKDSRPLICAVLVEYAKELNEDKLKRLCYENHNRFKEYDDTILDTWYMDDDTTLRILLKLRGMKGNFELNISISEEEGDDYAMRPLYVNLER
jgi:hypothetical protein